MDLSKFKRIETVIILAVIAVIGITFALTKDPLPLKTACAYSESGNLKLAHTEEQQSVVKYQGQECKNALDLLKSKYEVQTKNFEGIGEFVTGVNGVAADDQHFWAFYVNGAQAQVGAGQYVTKDSDVIEWKLEDIE